MYRVAQVPNYRSFFDINLELIFPGNWCYSFVFQNNFYIAPYGTFNHTFKKFWLMFCSVWFYTCSITQSYLQSLQLMQSFKYLSLSLAYDILLSIFRFNFWTPILSIIDALPFLFLSLAQAVAKQKYLMKRAHQEMITCLRY